MWVTVKCTCEGCGKKFDVSKNVPSKDAENFKDWAKYECKVCPDCYKAEKEAERAEKAEEAAKRNVERGLPELSGSSKQIAWAEQIREEAIEEAETFMENALPEYAEKAQEMSFKILTEITEAKKWIDLRNRLKSYFYGKIEEMLEKEREEND